MFESLTRSQFCDMIWLHMARKLLQKLRKRRWLISFLIAVGVVLGFFLLRGDNTSSYDFVVAERKTIVQEVIVTGRVKPVERVELAFEKTGTISKVLAEVGQQVRAGELLAQLDVQDAGTKVQNAEVDLQEAELALEKIKLEYAQFLRGDALNESYEDGLSTLTDFYGEYKEILDDLDDVLLGSGLSGGQESNIHYYANTTGELAVASRLERLFAATEDLYQKGVVDYGAAKRGSGEMRQKAVESGYDLAVQTAEVIKVGRGIIRSFQDKILTDTAVHSKQTIIDGHIASLDEHGVSMDTYVTDLLAAVNAINTQEDTSENYPLDVTSQELTVRQREIALQEAKDNLAKYSIAAPMDAIVARRDIRVGETVVANSSVLTVISEADYEIEADIPEADIAKLQVGNSAQLTLDAYGRDELFLATLTKIDPAEVIIEGVPTYKITLHFADADSRIRSGMTANINIRSAQKDNVITIPQRALIRENGKRLVRIVRDDVIERVEVETGLQGSDGSVEIVSGLQEGDKVVSFSQESSS